MTKTGSKPAPKAPAQPAASASSISTVKNKELAFLFLLMAVLAGGAICFALLG